MGPQGLGLSLLSFLLHHNTSHIALCMCIYICICIRTCSAVSEEDDQIAAGLENILALLKKN